VVVTALTQAEIENGRRAWSRRCRISGSSWPASHCSWSRLSSGGAID